MWSAIDILKRTALIIIELNFLHGTSISLSMPSCVASLVFETLSMNTANVLR